MDAKFISIVERLVNEQGKEALINAAKAKPLLADYAQNEFKKERHLLLIAIEAGAAQEIANAIDLEICKKIHIRDLRNDRFIDETAATEVVDLLALVLRGDQGKTSAATKPQPQKVSQYSQPVAINANATMATAKKQKSLKKIIGATTIILI
jgi:hypothetical protein